MVRQVSRCSRTPALMLIAAQSVSPFNPCSVSLGARCLLRERACQHATSAAHNNPAADEGGTVAAAGNLQVNAERNAPRRYVLARAQKLKQKENRG